MECCRINEVNARGEELLETLAEYLHRLGGVREPSASEALRARLYFTANEVLKAVETERYAW
ncbi:MAG: hypothetical protein QXE75_04970 [Sulfolobales archaeon]